MWPSTHNCSKDRSGQALIDHCQFRAHPEKLQDIGPVDLWHDRAVLHFFTEKEEHDAYFNLLRQLVKPGGFVILAAFNLNSADKCSGLPVHRYDKDILAEKPGGDFELIKAFDYTYTMPSGARRE